MEDFVVVNGYSNNYWGWGYEDDDLLFRCKEKFVKLDEIKIKNINNVKILNDIKNHKIKYI